MRTIVGAVIGAGWLLVPAPAFASMVSTSLGPIDSSCIHNVPNGAEVSSTGDVMMNGTLIAHYDGCDANSPSNNPPPTGYDGWVEGLTARAQSIGGEEAYDLFATEWQVPGAPSQQDGSILFLWSGIEICTGAPPCTTWNQIIQPVLAWNTVAAAPHIWAIEAVAGNAGLGQKGYYFSSAYQVNDWDWIYGLVQMVSATQWKIYILDENTGDSETLYWNPNTSDPFNWAQGGMLEAYASSAETGPLTSCLQLPQSTGASFSIDDSWQQGGAWNTFSATNEDWVAYTGSEVPSGCDWGVQSVSSEGTIYNNLFWLP